MNDDTDTIEAPLAAPDHIVAGCRELAHAPDWLPPVTDAQVAKVKAYRQAQTRLLRVGDTWVGTGQVFVRRDAFPGIAGAIEAVHAVDDYHADPEDIADDSATWNKLTGDPSGWSDLQLVVSWDKKAPICPNTTLLRSRDGRVVQARNEFVSALLLTGDTCGVLAVSSSGKPAVLVFRDDALVAIFAPLENWDFLAAVAADHADKVLPFGVVKPAIARKASRAPKAKPAIVPPEEAARVKLLADLAAAVKTLRQQEAAHAAWLASAEAAAEQAVPPILEKHGGGANLACSHLLYSNRGYFTSAAKAASDAHPYQQLSGLALEVWDAGRAWVRANPRPEAQVSTVLWQRSRGQTRYSFAKALNAEEVAAFVAKAPRRLFA